MKKLDLNNLGVEEMNAAELRTVEGGGLLGDGDFGYFLDEAIEIVNGTLNFVSKTVTDLISAVRNLLW
ncbi:hypothetical protein RYH73_06710 [Olivibacter sp. CPCC 100613]|uniref:hypothetical protein n=1 Tax=Olivibacter sp. CPCC 100613 TaxID=3079931 RepID=UPI002FF7EF28